MKRYPGSALFLLGAACACFITGVVLTIAGHGDIGSNLNLVATVLGITSGCITAAAGFRRARRANKK